MLLAANQFDEATEYSRRWSKKLSATLNFKTVLKPEQVTRKNAEKLIPSHKIIVFYNHGEADRLLAQGGNSNFLDKNNVDLVANKEVYTMACLSAKELGVEAWKRGAVYWGYTDVYGFITVEEELFCEQANYGLIVKLKERLSWKQAYEKSKEKDEELINKAKDIWSKIMLQHNSDCKNCYCKDNPPTESTCPLRKTALKMFGVKAWNLTKLNVLATFLFLVGWGITLHAIASELYLKGGISEVLSLQGEYFGLTAVLIGFSCLLAEHYSK